MLQQGWGQGVSNVRDPETLLHVPGHGVDAAPGTAAPSQPSWGPVWELAQGDVALKQHNWGQDEAIGEQGWLSGGTLLCSVRVGMGLLLHRVQP